MDELLQRAPEAHVHLQSIADPELQERLGSALMELGHVDLFDVNESYDIWNGTSHTYEPIAADQLTPEQGELLGRPADLMVRVAEVTSEASRVVEERKKVSPDDGGYYDSYFDVYEVAKDIALDRAHDAFERDDSDGTRSALETMLAVSLVSSGRYGDEGCARQIRNIVATGMATELYETARGMHGMVAIKEDGGDMHAVSVPGVLQGSTDLIKVATNTDFDDHMQHPVKLVREGLPNEDVRRREEMIDGMEHGEIAALANLAGRRLRNADRAAELSLRAGEKLTGEYYGRSDDDVVASAETVTALVEFGLRSSESGKQRLAETQLDRLRQMRSAGLQPYRTNNPITSVLDRAMVRLALEGKEDAVRVLMSSSSHEISPLDKPPTSESPDQEGGVSETEREFLDANLGWAIRTECPHASPNERYRVHKMFAKIQAEKAGGLRTHLADLGATPATIDSIIANSSDPDSAQAIPPEFWATYNEVTKQGEYGENGGHGSSPGDIRNLIEGGQSSDLASRAAAVSELLAAGVDPYDVSERIVVRVGDLGEQPGKEYVAQLTRVIEWAHSEGAQAELGDRFIQVGTFIDNASRFARPEEAIAIARQLFGADAPGELHRFAQVFESYDQRAPIMPDGDFMKTAEYLFGAFGEEQCQELLSNSSFPLDHLAKLGSDTVRVMVDGIQASPSLTTAVQLGFGADIFRYVATAYGESEPLQLLEGIYGDSKYGMQSVVDGLEGHETIQTAVLQELFRAQLSGMDEVSKTLRQYFDQTNLKHALVQYPDYGAKVLSSIRGSGHSVDTVSYLSEALLDQSLQVLVNEYTAPNQAAVIVDRICQSMNPLKTQQDILRVYEETDFLQERGIFVDFASHVEEWVKLLDAFPEGREGEMFQRLIVRRLQLDTGEDAAQAIRIFTEVAPGQEAMAQMRVEGFKLIYSLLAAESTRGYPSIKPGKLAEVFFDSEIADLYKQAFLLKQAGNTEQLQVLIGNLKPRESEEHEQQALSLSESIATLKEGVAGLKSQHNAASRWLREYAGQSIKAAKLIEAWKAREFALSKGIKDNPTEILYFVATEGLLQYASALIGEGKTDVTLQELEEYKEYAVELGGRYGQDSMFGAIERIIHFKREHGAFPRKIIPAFSASVSEVGKAYSAEILSADDPRGMTIGFDTGCCMTLGGASESCIWAGYEDARYSFMAVYDEGGKLRAQSVLYVVEQEGTKILVVDNIETNRGTDLSAVAAVYKKALVEMMKETETPFDAIHIGVGYTPEAILGSLPEARSYRTPKAGVYTDAASQRLLWSRATSEQS